MSEVSRELRAEPFLGDFQLGRDKNLPVFELGQTVVISDGILQGATGTIVRNEAGGDCLLSLGEQSPQIWAKFPAHLLRAT
jgi:hypothetical protein